MKKAVAGKSTPGSVLGDGAEAEGAPLNRRLSRGLSSGESFNTFDSTGNNSNAFLLDVNHPLSSKSSGSMWCSLLTQQALGTTIFALLGWYVPRYLIENETGLLEKQAPFQLTKAGDVIRNQELNFPVTDPATIPSLFLIYVSVFLPLAFVAIVSWVTTARFFTNPRIQLHHFHASIFGFLTAIGLSEGSTQLLKLYIQRRRPNFYHLCGFDDALMKCTAPPAYIREAQFSFPSGHSSLAMCAMTFLVLFCLGRVIMIAALTAGATSATKISAATGSKFNNNKITNNIRQLFFVAMASCVLFWGWAIFVGASRIVDKWHHPSDVLAGLLLGAITATISYHYWFCFLTPSAVLFSSSETITAISNGHGNGMSTLAHLPGMPWSLLMDALSSSSSQAKPSVTELTSEIAAAPSSGHMIV